jgi:hypothetical protein
MAFSQSHSAQTRTLVNQPCQYLPQGESSLVTVAKSLGQTNPFSHRLQTQNRSDTHSLFGLDLCYATEISKISLVPQGELEGGDLLIGAMREISQSPMFHLSVFPKGFTE